MECPLFSEDSPLQLVGYDHDRIHYRPYLRFHTLRDLLKTVCKPNAIVFDVGAGRGYSTVMLAALAKRGKVYAFESSAEGFAYLNHNILTNRLRNARSMHINLGLKQALQDAEEASVMELEQWARRRFVNRVDLLHIREPKCSWQILQGARRIITALRPVVVLHYDALTARQSPHENPERLFQFLQNHYSHMYGIARIS